MENIANLVGTTIRPRKSITFQQNPILNQNVKLTLNGQSMNSNIIRNSNSEINYYTSQNSSSKNIQGRSSGSSFYQSQNPLNPLNRVIIGNNQQLLNRTQSSIARQPIIHQNGQTMFTNSTMIPSQTSNIILNSPAHQLKKTSTFSGNHQLSQPYNILSQMFQNQPVIQNVSQNSQANRVTFRQNMSQNSPVIFKSDPLASQMNRLTQINQFLSSQYQKTNKQLKQLKEKTTQKQIVSDQIFLQRTKDRIDDIFLRQTNDALYKLDTIARRSSSCSKLQKSLLHTGNSKSFLKNTKNTQSRIVSNVRNNLYSHSRITNGTYYNEVEFLKGSKMSQIKQMEQ